MTLCREDQIGQIVVDSAIAVHRALGPGLLESVYEVALAHELERRGLEIERQVPIGIEYAGLRFEEGFRADILIEKRVILELKSIEQVQATHRKQIQTYLRLSECKLGFLLNFGDALMKDGITRAVNGLEEARLPQQILASWRENSLSRGRDQFFRTLSCFLPSARAPLRAAASPASRCAHRGRADRPRSRRRLAGSATTEWSSTGGG